MVSRRALTAFALVLVQLTAFAVFAQQSAEFGRGSGAEIVVTPKGSARFSGSLSVSTGTGYGLTAGGTLIEDRLWFFGSASRQSSTRFADLELPENATMSAIGASVNGQLADRHAFSAFFESARRPELTTASPSAFAGITPSSFLSLRYTGIVSDHVFFNASVTHSSTRRNGLNFPGSALATQ